MRGPNSEADVHGLPPCRPAAQPRRIAAPEETANHPSDAAISPETSAQLTLNANATETPPMTFSQAALDLLGQAVKLPLNLFADDEKKVYDRLDELHRHLPDTLPEKRFFKH